eukprot:7568750-Pyramimonas_sp.AAC.1
MSAAFEGAIERMSYVPKAQRSCKSSEEKARARRSRPGTQSPRVVDRSDHPMWRQLRASPDPIRLSYVAAIACPPQSDPI